MRLPCLLASRRRRFCSVEPRVSGPPAIPVGLPSNCSSGVPISLQQSGYGRCECADQGCRRGLLPHSDTLSPGGVESSAIKHILDWPSRFWSVGPSISETVYDGGLRRATVNQYIATYNANVAAYRQSVLTAFEQVEDSLAEVRLLSETDPSPARGCRLIPEDLAARVGALSIGNRSLSRRGHSANHPARNQQSLANLQVQEMTASVQLIESLGGGWDRSQLPTPAEVTAKPSRSETAIQH